MFDFPWRVSEQGYEWLEGEAFEYGLPPLHDPKQTIHGLFLIPQALYGYWRYFPLDDVRALFRTFADTAPTQEGILDFANRYGGLGAENYGFKKPSDKPGVFTIIQKADSFAFWQKMVLAMRRAVSLWDMAYEEDVDGLSSYIYWQDGGVYYSDTRQRKRGRDTVKGNWSRIADAAYNPEILEWLTPDDVVKPALIYLQEIINTHFDAYVAPRLLWEHDRTRLGLYDSPKNLLGALWLQLAQAIHRGKAKPDYRTCKECRVWFEITRGIGRPDKRFCTDACRQQAYRQRQLAQTPASAVPKRRGRPPKQLTSS